MRRLGLPKVFQKLLKSGFKNYQISSSKDLPKGVQKASSKPLDQRLKVHPKSKVNTFKGIHAPFLIKGSSGQKTMSPAIFRQNKENAEQGNRRTQNKETAEHGNQKICNDFH